MNSVRAKSALNGLLLIDKPILHTSHDVVDAVRRVLGERRVGHAGTLDPMATGLLIIMVGPSTTLFDTLSGSDKTYEGVMTFGYATATQDAEGRIVGTGDPGGITGDQVADCFAGFVGRIDQKAPLYSAVKKNGRKGYEAARRGQGDSFEAPVRQVEVKRLRLDAFQNPDAYFSCLVSRGTYIRTLAADAGERLGVPATLTALRRTSSGPFHVSDAVTPSALKHAGADELRRLLDLGLERASELTSK